MQTDMRESQRSETKRPIYRRRGFQVVAGVFGAVGLGLAWYLFSPLFLNKTVIEEFPTVSVAQTPAPTEPAVEVVAAEPTDNVTTTAGEVSEVTTSEPVAITEAPSGDAFDPIVLAEGEFGGADASHQGRGSATIYELEDGSRILRLENFDVTNGPALRVIISPNADPSSSSEVMETGFINLGNLKGNRGDQNYEIPADAVLPDGEFSIVIYCEPFRVVFATATLSA